MEAKLKETENQLFAANVEKARLNTALDEARMAQARLTKPSPLTEGQKTVMARSAAMEAVSSYPR